MTSNKATSNKATSNKQALAGQETELTEGNVRDFIRRHPDFLQRNPDLLDDLNIPHASGSAISLVEKQVSVLRERNVEMRHKLNDLTSNAKANDHLYDQTRSLVLKLLEAKDVAELSRAFSQAMSRDFQVEYSSLILFGEAPANSGDTRFENADNATGEIGALIKSRKAVCGVLRQEELAYLFPGARGIGSAAVMPLISDDVKGVVAVGSSDARRYNNDMGTIFLGHIAEVLVRLLPRF